MYMLIKRLKRVNKNINLKIITEYSLIVFFIGYILYNLYGQVFNTFELCISFIILTLIVRMLQRIIKNIAVINVLHTILIFISIIIPITFILNIPHYTKKQAIKIVEEDILNRYGKNVEFEFQVREKKVEEGNSFVNQNYELHFRNGEDLYVYIFDPLTGNYKRK